MTLNVMRYVHANSITTGIVVDKMVLLPQCQAVAIVPCPVVRVRLEKIGHVPITDKEY